MEIKKTAKQGQMGAVKIMAKDLIHTREQITKFNGFKSQLQGISLRIQSTEAMAEAMKGVTKAMGQMNRQLNLPALQKIMMEFERENEKMEMRTEVMGDAIDDALEGDEGEETDELVSQMLDEIGIDLDSQVNSALYAFVIDLFLCPLQFGQGHGDTLFQSNPNYCQVRTAGVSSCVHVCRCIDGSPLGSV